MLSEILCGPLPQLEGAMKQKLLLFSLGWRGCKKPKKIKQRATATGWDPEKQTLRELSTEGIHEG